jgi:hypothetical protein
LTNIQVKLAYVNEYDSYTEHSERQESDLSTHVFRALLSEGEGERTEKFHSTFTQLTGRGSYLLSIEGQIPMQNVAGSIPISRSNKVNSFRLHPKIDTV